MLEGVLENSPLKLIGEQRSTCELFKEWSALKWPKHSVGVLRAFTKWSLPMSVNKNKTTPKGCIPDRTYSKIALAVLMPNFDMDDLRIVSHLQDELRPAIRSAAIGAVKRRGGGAPRHTEGCTRTQLFAASRKGAIAETTVDSFVALPCSGLYMFGSLLRLLFQC